MHSDWWGGARKKSGEMVCQEKRKNVKKVVKTLPTGTCNSSWWVERIGDIKGTVVWDFLVSIFFIFFRPLMNAWKYFGILFWFGWYIHEAEKTFRVWSAESQNFPRILPRKGVSFRGIIRGKSKLSENYTSERRAFPRYDPRKVETLQGLYRGKIRLSAV